DLLSGKPTRLLNVGSKAIAAEILLGYRLGVATAANRGALIPALQQRDLRAHHWGIASGRIAEGAKGVWVGVGGSGRNRERLHHIADQLLRTVMLASRYRIANDLICTAAGRTAHVERRFGGGADRASNRLRLCWW